MEISTRTKQLKAIFSYDKKVILEDQPLEIRPYHFIQNMGVNEIEQFQQLIPTSEFCSIPDNNIRRTRVFRIPYSRLKDHEKRTRQSCYYTG